MASHQTKARDRNQGHRQRLRDRFARSGLHGFHDYEVVELLLTLNTPRKDCKPAAKSLMEQFKTLQAVLEADVPALCRTRGVGPVNALGITLVKQVADRYLENKLLARDAIRNKEELVRFLSQVIGHRTTEAFMVIFLDAKNRVLKTRILFEGSLTASAVYPREVVKAALAAHAAAVIFAHNHPSGDVAPSDSDIRLTRKLCYAMTAVGVTVHEHLVVGRDRTWSFAEQGLIREYNHQFDPDMAG